jgi:hypothetical protein
MTLTIHLPDDLGRRLREEATSAGTDEAGYLLDALRECLGMARPAAAVSEIELIERINATGFDEEFWRRYDALRRGQRESALAPDARAELLAMNDRLEEAGARRMVFLIELANRRGVTVPEVMAQLGIKPHQVSGEET